MLYIYAVRVTYIDILIQTVAATNYENQNCNCFYRQKMKLSYHIIRRQKNVAILLLKRNYN